jgi:hypothetical protein
MVSVAFQLQTKEQPQPGTEGISMDDPFRAKHLPSKV